MTHSDWKQTAARIRELVLSGDTTGISDRLLLKLFVTERDEAAFEALVRRHGPMVLGVCRRVLPSPSDAEDAFQATFLVFVRKAAALAEPDLLANWLYGVAYRTARTARGATQRRRAKEGQVIPRQVESSPTDLHDLLPLLDEELNRLPAKYRVPIVLCDLEQKRRKEVAAALGLPEGTLASRLARARSLLAKRLARRGVTLTGAALAAILGETAAATSPELVQVTVAAGAALLAGQAGSLSLASTNALKISETVMKTMFLNKLKALSAILVGGILLTAGAGTMIAQHGRLTAVPAGAEPLADLDQAPNDKNAAAELLRSALEAISGVADSQAKSKLLLRIANAQVAAGARAGALATADKALIITQNWPTAGAKVQGLLQVARLQAAVGQKQLSRATAQAALEATFAIAKTANIDGQFANSTAVDVPLQNVVQLLSSWEEYDECLRIAKEGKPLGDRQVGRARGGSDDGLPALVIQSMASGIGRHERSDSPARQALQRGTELVEENIRTFPMQIHASSDGPGPRALEALAAAYVRLGDLEDAFKTSETMEALPWGYFSRNKPNALQAIASAQAREGDFQGARETISRPNFSDKPGSFRTVILGRIAENQIAKVDLPGALKTTADLINVQQKANVLLAIAGAQLNKGDRAAALDRLEEIRKLNEPMPGKEKNTGGIAYLNAPSTLVVQADLEARLGDFQAAQKTASKLTEARDEVQALSAIGAQFLAAKRMSEARQSLRQASEAAVRMQEQPPAGRSGERQGAEQNLFQRNSRMENLRFLKRLAELQAKAGDAEGALQTAKQLAPGSFLSWLVIARAEGGDIDGAIDWLTLLNNQDDKSTALEQLAGILAKSNEEARALALAAKQESSLSKAYTLLGIAIEKTKN
jgi:RNA polymerase sigma factor (sigma-70 family)